MVTADRIRFDFPELPESVNNLYFVQRGRKVMTKAGQRYKNLFVGLGGGVSRSRLIHFVPDPEQEYDLHIWCFLPYLDLYNFKFGRDKRVKYPFKNKDTSNYVKLAEDCVAALFDLRDFANFSIHAHKREAPDDLPRLVAVLQPLDLGQDPYPCPTE